MHDEFQEGNNVEADDSRGVRGGPDVHGRRPGAGERHADAALGRADQRRSSSIWAASGFTIRVNGTERQIPANDVAVIDFTGGTMSDADWARLMTGSSCSG